MFGRRSRDKESREAAEREQSRRALFEELAKRPANICPFLGLASSQTEYHDGFTREHRCYAFGDPVELSAEQQERVCLGRGYGNCPRYLRGVLVIPTEELEALRRPLPPVRPPARPHHHPSPAPPAASVAAAVASWPCSSAVLLLAVAGTAGALLLLNGPGVAADPTPTPQCRRAPCRAPALTPSRRAVAHPRAESPDPVPGDPQARPDAAAG